MRIYDWLVVPAASALAACAQASAAAPDTSSDIDCSVLAFYFNGLAEHRGAPLSQRRATQAVHEWYSIKVQKISREKGADAVLSRAGPLLETTKQDPMKMRAANTACADRALNEGLR
jgi:hypothetical protein